VSNAPRTEAAKRTIRDVLVDPGRSLEQLLDDMIELREEIDVHIGALQEDIHKSETAT
jgi:hypothetical protein